MTSALKVKIRHISMRDLCDRLEGEDADKKPDAYEFSNGRKFKDSGKNGGPYAPTS